MMLQDKVYNILKWIVMLLIPAIITLYTSLAPVWGWPLADEIAKTLSAVALFIGTIVGISTINYNKENNTDQE